MNYAAPTLNVDALVRCATQLWIAQPGLSRDALTKLLGKCSKGVPQLRGKRSV